jgi:hypothetical protein
MPLAGYPHAGRKAHPAASAHEAQERFPALADQDVEHEVGRACEMTITRR